MSDVELPESVRLETGPGASPVVRVDGPDGWAEVHLHGAHVTAWGPRGESSALWLSPLSSFDADTAIRGGIPLCFPWFGPLAGHPDAPRHGLGRTALWTLDGAEPVGRDVVVRLRLSDDASTRASAWPDPFDAVCTVTVGRHLTVALEFTHRGSGPVRLEGALHTYLAVDDVTAVEIDGLAGVELVDRTADGARTAGVDGPLHIVGEVDRIYLDTTAPVSVRDVDGGVDGRQVTVAKSGSSTTVVWNPGTDAARATADIGDGGWRGFVCVEASNVGSAAIPLAPGATHILSSTLTVAQSTGLPTAR